MSDGVNMYGKHNGMYLFLGGPKDGERMAISMIRPIEVPVMNKGTTTFHFEKYMPQRFAGPTVLITVFVHEGLTLDEAVLRIVNGYQSRGENAQQIEKRRGVK